MKMSDETLNIWLDDAKKATQGAWRTDDGAYVENIRREGVCVVVKEYERDSYNDAYHITNACPQNFIALIEELKARRFKDRPMEEYEEIARLCGEYKDE